MWYFTFDQSLPHSYGLEVQKHKLLESNGDPLDGLIIVRNVIISVLGLKTVIV